MSDFLVNFEKKITYLENHYKKLTQPFITDCKKLLHLSKCKRTLALSTFVLFP